MNYKNPPTSDGGFFVAENFYVSSAPKIFGISGLSRPTTLRPVRSSTALRIFSAVKIFCIHAPKKFTGSNICVIIRAGFKDFFTGGNSP